MSDILPHFLFHYPEIRTTVSIRIVCTMGARTRVDPHARCQSVTVTDLQAESGDADKRTIRNCKEF